MKGRGSRQADRKGRSARSRTGRGAGGVKPGGTGAVSPKIPKSLKLSLRGVLRYKLNIDQIG